MNSTDLTETSFPRLTRFCGLTILFVGAAALVGWRTRIPVLVGIRSSYIPMAPNTALAFIVMGLGLMAVVGRGRIALSLAGSGAVVVMLVGALSLFEMATGLHIDIDRWFFRTPSARFGLAEIGKMATFTAFAFLAAGLSLVLQSGPSRRGLGGDLAGTCGLVSGLTGLVFASAICSARTRRCSTERRRSRWP